MNLSELRRNFENIITAYGECESAPPTDLKQECCLLAKKFQDKIASGHSLVWLLDKCWAIAKALVECHQGRNNVSMLKLFEWRMLSVDAEGICSGPNIDELLKDLYHEVGRADQGYWEGLEMLTFIHSSTTTSDLVVPVHNKQIQTVARIIDSMIASCHTSI